MLATPRASLRVSRSACRGVAFARPSSRVVRQVPTTHRFSICNAGAEDAASDAALGSNKEVPSDTKVVPTEEVHEETFYEGSGSDKELLVSCLLGLSLIYAPLTMASIGRRLWFKLKITNKRVIISFNSPTTKEEAQFTYDKIKEVRAIERAFGAWGDMVVYLKNGKNIEIVGQDNVRELEKYVNEKALAARGPNEF